jgi:hypothetical protein
MRAATTHPPGTDHWRAVCQGNRPARFGKRPTEKDPNHGHLAGGPLHSRGARRSNAPGLPGLIARDVTRWPDELAAVVRRARRRRWPCCTWLDATLRAGVKTDNGAGSRRRLRRSEQAAPQLMAPLRLRPARDCYQIDATELALADGSTAVVFDVPAEWTGHRSAARLPRQSSTPR